MPESNDWYEPKLHKQHPVPQHIMGVEFRLVGDLTIRQFFWVGGGLILGYFFYSTPLPQIIRYVLGGGVALIGLSVAFLPIQDIGLERWITNFFKAINSPTQRVWMKSEIIPDFFLLELQLPLARSQAIPLKDRSRLESYLKTLEKRAMPATETMMDKTEREFLKKWGFEPISQAAAVTAASVQTVPYKPIYTETETGRPQPTATLASEINYALQPVINIPVGGKIQMISSIRNIRPGRNLTNLVREGAPRAEVAGELIIEKPAEKISETPRIPLREVKPEQHQTEIKSQLLNIRQRMTELKETVLPMAMVKSPEGSPPALVVEKPKVAISPPSPVAPERITPPWPTTPTSENRETGLPEMQRKLTEERGRREDINLYYESKMNELKRQNSSLSNEITRILKEVDDLKKYTSDVTAKNEAYSRRLKEEETRLEGLAKEKGETEENLARLQKEVVESRLKLAGRAADLEKNLEAKMSSPKIPHAKIPPLVRDLPNVINGLVREKDGRLIDGAVVIVKDDENEPVRALKTNGLGQFIITTPVPNGRFTVSVEKRGLTFDIITVDVLGGVLEPLEFIARE